MASFDLAKTVRTLLLAACVFVLGASRVTASPVYLKAGATGLNNGTSWENAYTNFAAAVSAVSGAADKTIYAAEGIYQVTATITLDANFNGIAIYGGFAGVSMDETPAGRDVDANQTVVFGYKNTDLENLKWKHVEPQVEGYSYAETLTAATLFLNGKLNMPPPFTGDYDGYYLCHAKNWTYFVSGLFSVGNATSITLDGLYFTGFGGTVVALNAGYNAAASVNLCRFVGFNPHGGAIGDPNNSNNRKTKLTVTNTKFMFAMSTDRGAALTLRAAADIRNCEFVSLLRVGDNGGNGGHVIYWWAGSGENISDSVFTRNFDRTSAQWLETTYGGGGCIIGSEGGTGAFSGCVFTNNMASSEYTQGEPLFNTRDAAFSRCVIANNRVNVKPIAERAYTLFGATAGRCAISLDGCLFASNTVAAPQVAATTGTFALGTAGNRTGYEGRLSFLNCAFIDNLATNAATAGVSVVKSRGVLVSEGSTAAGAGVGIANCTFAGKAVAGLQDIVQFGSANSKALNIVNSLFMTGGEIAAPFLFDKPGKVNLAHNTIKNLVVPPDGMASVAGHQYDAVPLVADVQIAPATASAHHAPRPAAFTPGLRTTADVATNSTSLPYSFQYRLSGGAWVPLNPAASLGVNPSGGMIADCAGNSRPAGSFTRGAVQPLAATAETGPTLTLRRDPLLAGTLSMPNTQAVPSGNAITPVTATATAPGASFSGWFGGDGTLYSGSATLSIASLTTNLVLTARFDTPEVAVTFDLGAAGTFTENNQHTITKTFKAGSSPFTAPPFTADEDYLVFGWLGMGNTAPWATTTMHVDAVTKAVRVFHMVPPGDPALATGDGSGSDWSNPSGDIQAACDDAGRYRGELWFKGGTYPIALPVEPRANVSLVGGFAGNETSASAANPALHPVIFTGDLAGDNYWKTNNVVPVSKIMVLNDDVFAEPNPVDVEAYWKPTSVGADTTDCLLQSNPDAPVTNAVIRGIAFTGFGISAVRLLANSDVNFVGCRFIGCNTTASTAYAVIDNLGAVSLLDCDFLGNYHTTYFGGTYATATNRIIGCTFDANTGDNFGTCLFIGNASTDTGSLPTFVTNTVFRRNRGATVNSSCSAVATLYRKNTRLVFDGCLFEDNRSRGGCSGAILSASTSVAEFRRCRFVGNSYNWSGCNNNSQYTHAPCIMGQATVRDSLFKDNWCTGSNAGASGAFVDHIWASTCALVTGYLNFLNCTFVDNHVEIGAIGGTYDLCGTVGMHVDKNNTRGIAVANCVLTGNTIAAAAARNAEFCARSCPDANQNTLSIVNSVVDGSGAGYAPFVLPATVAPSVYHSAITGYDAGDFTLRANDFVAGASADQVPLRGLRTGEAGIPQIGISNSSPYIRAGVPVYLSGADLYVHAPDTNADKPWRKLCQSWTMSASAPKGVSADAIEPDGWGEPRLAGRIAYGPLNAPAAGTVLLFR